MAKKKMSKDECLDRFMAIQDIDAEISLAKELLDPMVRPMLEDSQVASDKIDAITHDLAASMMPGAQAAKRQAYDEIFTQEELTALVKFSEKNPTLAQKSHTAFRRTTELHKVEPQQLTEVILKHVPEMRDEFTALMAEQAGM